uniref:Uncharacterized protein n=1 Tax=Magallana gigas TaxID=29159 RepID=K1QS44_MAGGI
MCEGSKSQNLDYQRGIPGMDCQKLVDDLEFNKTLVLTGNISDAGNSTTLSSTEKPRSTFITDSNGHNFQNQAPCG